MCSVFLGAFPEHHPAAVSHRADFGWQLLGGGDHHFISSTSSSGWWARATPLKNDGVKVNWDDDYSQYFWENKPVLLTKHDEIPNKSWENKPLMATIHHQPHHHHDWGCPQLVMGVRKSQILRWGEFRQQKSSYAF